ncbi:MAG: hypothetical protein Q7S11_03925 [bacterium]|nr:hypothetical protein [bacterium]
MQFFKPLRHTLLSITLAVILSVLGGWFIFGGGATETQIVSAGSTDNLSGYAWSSNIGWISFNCINPLENCGTSNYGVHIANDTLRFTPGAKSDITGTAWSSNIGWISFDRNKTGNPPSSDIGSGVGPIAQITWSPTPYMSGWARALAGCQNILGVPASSCSGSGPGLASGGWDGWIKLRSTVGEPNYGITLNSATNKLTGFAWGGDVVGWVKFASTVGEPSYGVVFTPIGTLPPVGCGIANNVPVAPPTGPISANLCSDGSTPLVTNNNTTAPYSWSWTCANGGSPVSCSAPYTQCSDGIDNDGDTRIDNNAGNDDPGCKDSLGVYSPTRNNERNFKFNEF